MTNDDFRYMKFIYSHCGEVERCTGITEVMGSNLVRAWIFFRSYFKLLVTVVFLAARILISFLHLSANIWISYLKSSFITWMVYLDPTHWLAPSWLVSSVVRALQRYCRGHGLVLRCLHKFLFGLYKNEFDWSSRTFFSSNSSLTTKDYWN